MRAARIRDASPKGRAGRLVMRYGALCRLHEFFASRYSRDVLPSGTPASPRRQATDSIWYSLLSVPPAACAALILLLMLAGTPLALVFLASPAIVFLTRLFGLRDAIRRRRRGVESELFFFVIYCDIMEKTGRGLCGALDALRAPATSLLFPHMHREALFVRREIQIFSRSFADVLHELAGYATADRQHPSAAFRDFLRGYIVSQSSGGTGTAQYLHEKLREYHVAARQQMTAYASTAEMLATVGSFGLVMFPIFVVVGGIMISPDTLLFLCAFGILLGPTIIVLLIKKAAAGSPIPAASTAIRRWPIAVAAVAAALAYTAGLTEWWELAAIPLAAWSISNFCAARRQLAAHTGLEKSLPAFIRDINQKMRASPSFFAAFQACAASAAYTARFNLVLRRISSRVSLGVEVSRALEEARTSSWLADCVFGLLSHAARSGSVTPAVLDRLATFASHHLETRQDLSQKTATPLMTGYMGSIIVVMMILTIPVMSFEQFAAFDELLDADLSTQQFETEGLLADLNMVLVVVGAFCSMLLVSQIRYGTVMHTLHTGILLLAVVGMLYYDRYVGVSLGGL